MSAVGDFFGRLQAELESKFGPDPPSPCVPCAAKALKVWRATNKATIDKALASQKAMLSAKKIELERWNDADKTAFTKAFGVADDAAKKTISDRVNAMLKLNSVMTEDNFKPADPSKPDRFAYVTPTDTTHTVYLDTAFGTAGDLGQDSKAGVMAHEMSHFNDVGKTKDKFADYQDNAAVYGLTASRELAAARPDLALRHADSFEYYVENVP